MEWKKLGQTEEKVGYKWVTTKTYEMPDGRASDYTTWHRTSGRNVATIALTADNQVVVARQFRPGPERILDEIPGGDADNNEDLAVAAARELSEETGYVSKDPLLLLGTACRDAYSNETDYYFLATNCESNGQQQLDEGEHVQVALISIAQLVENAKTAKMSDAIAVFMAYDRLQEIQHGYSQSH